MDQGLYSLTGEELFTQKYNKGMFRFSSRIWIPNVTELKNEILREAHNSRYSIHPGSTKMYQDLKQNFWWPGMKKEIADWTDGQSGRMIETIEYMLRVCALDFKGNWDDHLPLIEFSYNNSYHAIIGMPPYEALYGCKCRPPLYWDEVGEKKLLGPELVQQTKDVVVLIRKRFGQKGKLSPRRELTHNYHYLLWKPEALNTVGTTRWQISIFWVKERFLKDSVGLSRNKARSRTKADIHHKSLKDQNRSFDRGKQ
ncbi:hypothetical protein AgCh_017302 [Apium graveolens]